VGGIVIPSGAATKTGAWGDADQGDLLGTTPPPPGADPDVIDAIPIVWRWNCWGLDGNAAPIADPDKVIFLAAVMENDDASPKAVRATVSTAMAGALANVVNSGMSRAAIVDRLRNDMDGALNLGRVSGAPNFDDRVGGVKGLRLTADDLKAAANGGRKKKLEFAGDGGQYRVEFTLSKG
jgi:hypothetical protein